MVIGNEFLVYPICKCLVLLLIKDTACEIDRKVFNRLEIRISIIMNMPILCYSDEIRSAFMMIHGGENAQNYG